MEVILGDAFFSLFFFFVHSFQNFSFCLKITQLVSIDFTHSGSAVGSCLLGDYNESDTPTTLN